MDNPFDQFSAAPSPAAANPFDQFGGTPPATSTTSGSGLAANLGAGFDKGIGANAGMITDLIMNPRAIVDQAWNLAAKVTGSNLQNPTPAVSLGTVNRALLGQVNPDLVQAKTPAERIAQGVGAGIGAGLSPAGDALTVGRLLANGMIGAGSGAASAGAQEAAPEKYKTVAALLGGLAGGLTVAGAEGAVRAGARAATEAAAPIAAAVSPAAAEQQAAATIADRATDPAAASVALGAPGDAQLVPGSEPTTFQQTGDMGLGSLEREQQTKNPAPFQERRAAQNSARVDALQSIQGGGDPNALAAGIKSNFDVLDADTQAHLDALTASNQADVERTAAVGDASTQARLQEAQGAASVVGGLNTPEAYGEATRSAVAEAESAARARESGLWKAIDPNSDLTGNTLATSQAAKEIMGGLPSTAKPMVGEEAGSFQAAADLPALAPVQDLIALRSRISTEMRNELIANGRSPSYARLTQLRGAIQDNLANTVSQQVSNDAAAVSRGALDDADSTASRIQGWVDEYKSNRAAQAVGVGGEGAGIPAAPGTAISPSADGTGLPPEGGPAGATSNQGLPPAQPTSPGLSPSEPTTTPGQPTFDDAAAQRLAAATAATKERARTFGLNPVAPVTAKAGAQDLFKLPDGRVPAKFFHPGPTGYTDMQALFTAAGQDKVLPIIADYAASSLRKAAMREDGTLDPVKYSRWVSAHADALRALPTAVRTRFAAAADAAKQLGATTSSVAAANAVAAKTAAQTITAAAAARALTLKGFQGGSIGRVMGLSSAEDVTRTIGQILGARTSNTEMALLARAARKAGPEAIQGLRQAVADHIMNRFISNTEAGTTGVNQIKADGFQTFVRANKGALKSIFSDEEIANMQAIADDIHRAKRSENAVKIPAQSNTAQDLTALRASNKSTNVVGRTVLDGIAGGVGFALHGPLGAIGAAVGAHALQAMREAGINRVDELITQALLHPQIAQELLKKAPPRTIPAAPGSGLARALRTSAIASTAASGP